jgi:carbonic anhydrase
MSGTGTPERVRKGAAKADALILALGANIDEAIRRERLERTAANSERQKATDRAAAARAKAENVLTELARLGNPKLTKEVERDLLKRKGWSRDTVRRALRQSQT